MGLFLRVQITAPSSSARGCNLAFGLTPEGFNPKTTADVLSSVQAAQTQQIDPNLDLQPTNPLGVLNGIVADEIGQLWQALLGLYSGMSPDDASDDQLTSLGLLTGTRRNDPQPTQVLACTVNVDAGFNAAPGTMFAHIVGDAVAVFANKEIINNPNGFADDLTVDFVAIADGPQQCLAHTLTVIAQPLTGWNSVDNGNDGITGANIESDASLRLRREQELSAAGTSTAEAIRSAILEASQQNVFSSLVQSCTVLTNDTDSVDVNGLPAHSFEVICYQPGHTDDDDQALADLIASNKGGGINTWGGVVKSHVDSQGLSETIRFTRPDPIQIYIAITIVRSSTEIYAGDAAIKQVLADYGNTIGAGGTVVIKHLEARTFDVKGVFDIASLLVDMIPSPIGTSNIVINIRQVPTFSTANVDVTS